MLLHSHSWARTDGELPAVTDPLLFPVGTKPNLLPLVICIDRFRIWMIPKLRAPLLFECLEKAGHHLPFHNMLGFVVPSSIPSAPSVVSTRVGDGPTIGCNVAWLFAGRGKGVAFKGDSAYLSLLGGAAEQFSVRAAWTVLAFGLVTPYFVVFAQILAFAGASS